MMTIEEYQEHSEDSFGYCTTCKCMIECDFIEPDAHHYLCPECNQKTLMGLEEALIEGFVQ